MEWWTLFVALISIAFTKIGDHLSAFLKDKRDFKRHRTEMAYTEIEELKDKIGKLYELSVNWKGYEVKGEEYHKVFQGDHDLIGKYNKYPEIATAARDIVHLCKIVAANERDDDKGNLIERKKELPAKYKDFIQVCDKYIEKLV